MAPLDRLPAAKQAAQIGAVIGREFSQNLLTPAAELSEAQLAKGLNELVAAGLVFCRVTAQRSSTTGLAAIQPGLPATQFRRNCIQTCEAFHRAERTCPPRLAPSNSSD
jgi:hypothetical protein